MTIFKTETISPNGLGFQVAEILCVLYQNGPRSQTVCALITATYCFGSDVCSTHRAGIRVGLSPEGKIIHVEYIHKCWLQQCVFGVINTILFPIEGK